MPGIGRQGAPALVRCLALRVHRIDTCRVPRDLFVLARVSGLQRCYAKVSIDRCTIRDLVFFFFLTPECSIETMFV